MERLFNSSITRKCPPEHEEQGKGRGGWLFGPPSLSLPAPHIYQPVKSAGEQRRLEVLHGKPASAGNVQAGISRVAGFVVTFVFAALLLIWISAERPGEVLGALGHPRAHPHTTCTCSQLVSALRSSRLRDHIYTTLHLAAGGNTWSASLPVVLKLSDVATAVYCVCRLSGFT